MSPNPNSLLLGGQDRPFEVGTNQAELFCNLPNRLDAEGRAMTLKNYYSLFATTDRLLGGPLRDFLYTSLLAGYERDRLRVDFTVGDVGRWMDAPETPAEEVAKPLNVMLAQLQAKAEAEADRAKNGPAPKSKAAGLTKAK